MIAMPRRLTTARLELRPPRLADAASVFSFTGDPVVTRLLDWPTHADLDDTVSFLEAVADGWAAGDDYCWVVEHDGTMIGSVGCQIDEHGAQLGYVLAYEFWGAGFATEAAGTIMTAACANEHVYRVWATCDTTNLASTRVLEKLGLRYEARLSRWSRCPNLDGAALPRDMAMYAWVR